MTLSARSVVAVVVVIASACETPPFCGGRLADACRKARDLGYATGVDAGDDLASGNAIAGQSGAIDARGRVLVSVRVTGSSRDNPSFSGIAVRTDSSVAPSRFGVSRGAGTAVSVDVAVSAVRGMRVGDTRVGGIDFLGSVVAIPNPSRGGLDVSGSPAILGLGVRLGVIGATRTLPAIALTGSLRTPRRFNADAPSLPTDDGGTVRIELRSGKISTMGYRLASSKQIGRIALTAGVGQDVYDASVGYRVTGSDTLGAGSDGVSFDVTRTNVFGGISYSAGRVTFVVEGGRLTGGRVPAMLNTFGARSPTARREYLSLGVRIPAGRTLDPD